MHRSRLGAFAVLIAAFFAVDAASQIPRIPGIRPAASPTPAKQESPARGTAPNTATNAAAYPKYFYFTTAAKGKDRLLKAADLTACISGDNADPPNKNAFKKVVPTVGGQKGRVIDAGTCDVVVLVIKDAEGEKNLERDNEGFAVYRIAGNDLEQVFAPKGGEYIAVGKKDLAGADRIAKVDVVVCGPSEIRDSYRPSPNTWKSWSNYYMDEERMGRLTPEASPLGRSCDLWIMTPSLFKAFEKRFGTGFPIFDVSPSNPELVRRK